MKVTFVQKLIVLHSRAPRLLFRGPPECNESYSLGLVSVHSTPLGHVKKLGNCTHGPVDFMESVSGFAFGLVGFEFIIMYMDSFSDSLF